MQVLAVALTAVLILVSVAAIVGGFALLARRLLGMRFGLVRLVLAGLVGFAVAGPIAEALAGSIRGGGTATPLWFLLLAGAAALVVAMVFLVVAEALVPSGSLPGPLELRRALEQAFEASMQIEPNRFWSLYGAARAAVSAWRRSTPASCSRSRPASACICSMVRCRPATSLARRTSRRWPWMPVRPERGRNSPLRHRLPPRRRPARCGCSSNTLASGASISAEPRRRNR